MLRRSFTLDGTADRREALACAAVAVLTLAAVMALMLQIRRSGLEPLAFALLGVTTVWLLATLVRRLHDSGRTGIWVLLCVVPLVGLIAMLVIVTLPSRAAYPAPKGAARHLVGHAALLAVLAFFVLRGFFVPYFMNSSGMAPTVIAGDYLVMHRVGWRPARGDVAVFVSDRGDIIQRIIGMPGDRVAMRDGVPVINGTPVTQSASGTETLPDGRAYTVQNLSDTAPGDNVPEIAVPLGHYYMLGDNRDNSADSRWSTAAGGMGTIPADALLGRVTRAIFVGPGGSLADFRAWRADRFFIAVK